MARFPKVSSASLRVSALPSGKLPVHFCRPKSYFGKRQAPRFLLVNRSAFTARRRVVCARELVVPEFEAMRSRQ